jgi:hypothetical protein
MSTNLYIMLAPIQLAAGVDEEMLLAASERFQAAFVEKQPGILKRILLRAKHGGYADLVFFASKDDADRVAAAEQTSTECHEYFKIMLPPDPNLPDMGVLSFEHAVTYDSKSR